MSALATQPTAVAGALASLRAGGTIVIYDERTDTGDLVAAAELVDAATINFMVREARGFVAVALTAERCDRLGVRAMCEPSRPCGDRALPNVTIEARAGTTTGISAADRARTIIVAGREASGPRDLISPGHVPPLRAAPGGLLAHPGRVEAAVDAVALAGLEPAAAICDALNEDGELAGREDLARLELPHVSVGELTLARFDAWAAL